MGSVFQLKKLSSLFLFSLFFVFFGYLPFREALAQADPSQVLQRRAELETQLAEYEKQINQYQSLITEKRDEKASLERDIAILNANISKAKLAIKRRNLAIEGLSQDIGLKAVNIRVLEGQIGKSKEDLALILQRLRENDDLSVIELALVYQDITAFFDSLESFNRLQESMQATLGEFKTVKSSEEIAKSDLEARKQEEMELKKIQELEKQVIEQNEREKKQLLQITKGKELEYDKMLKDRQKNAAAIRSQLFLLTGSPDIPFEKALDLANKAYNKTGVRPAFILSIITQETNLGQNIGQCLLTNSPKKGDGKGKNTGRFFSGVMKPTRDVDPYVEITANLGLDPFAMPVSCPPGYGYGGGMGPAQFIASTWRSFSGRIANATGHNPPNPWSPEDAFMASAIYLSDLGADGGSRASEREAALRYFAGSNWKNPSYAFYGDDVLAISDKYQGQIDILQSLAQR